MRGNTFFLARSTLGYPPDFYESRSLYALPHFVRWMILFFTTFHLRNWRQAGRPGVELVGVVACATAHTLRHARPGG